MLSVVMLNAVMLCEVHGVFKLNVVILMVNMLNLILLIVVMLNVAMLSVIMPGVLLNFLC
jgi:hypothetical protein